MIQEIKVSEDEKYWVKMLSDGKPAKEIAKEIGLPEGTFAYKLNLLRERTGASNMASLVAFFIKNGFIE